MEKYQIVLSPGVEKAEVIIREVSSVNELPVKAPIKVAIAGTIGAVTEFLRKRLDQPDQINQKHCYILVDREKINIQLIINEQDEYLHGIVTAKLEYNSKFTEFGINSDTVSWTPTKLGLFLKMNRYFFTDAAKNAELVSQLMHYKATIQQKVDQSAESNGNRTDDFAQTVNSNLPKTFSLCMPIFKSMKAETFEIETFANVDGRDVTFVLISPAASQITEEVRDKAIDKELDEIKQLCPDIAIIEK